MITSYITEAEALLLFPNSSEYIAGAVTQALALSYSMVNSFLDPVINVPAIDTDGSIPGVIKIHQAKFYQWILESGNQGWTEELQALHDSTRDALKMITEQDIFVSEVQVSASEIGWNMDDSTLTSGKVYIYNVAGNEPIEEITYRFVVTVAGYASAVELTYYGPGSAAVLGVITNVGEDYVQIEDSTLWIRLSGLFVESDEFDIKGIPATVKIASNKPQLQQSVLLY